jgi:hypothetical protein
MCAVNEMTKEELKRRYHHDCSDCGARLDEDDCVLELDDCHYSPKVCDTCGYQPCDWSC